MCFHMYIILISPCIKDRKKVIARSSEYLKSEIYRCMVEGRHFLYLKQSLGMSKRKIRVKFCVFHLTLLYVWRKYLKKKVILQFSIYYVPGNSLYALYYFYRV